MRSVSPCLRFQELDSRRGKQVEEVQDGRGYLALLAGVPGVLHCQQLLRLQPLLQVLYQLLACSSTRSLLVLLITTHTSNSCVL